MASEEIENDHTFDKENKDKENMRKRKLEDLEGDEDHGDLEGKGADEQY